MFFPEFLQVLALGHPSGWAVASSSFRFPINWGTKSWIQHDGSWSLTHLGSTCSLPLGPVGNFASFGALCNMAVACFSTRPKRSPIGSSVLRVLSPILSFFWCSSPIFEEYAWQYAIHAWKKSFKYTQNASPILISTNGEILRPRDCRNGLLAMNVLSSRGHVQFYIGNPCAILSTISLFLHEQMHAI